jgi:AcrR family transcriptional regulator
VSQKDENYWRILNSAVSLDIRHGHLKWTMTQLSRVSHVSRTLIYYYFGKSKQTILTEAISLFGAEFAGETPERINKWKGGELAETFLASRELLLRAPALIPFYFLNRSLKNEIGESIRSKEKAFRKKISQFFPDLTLGQREFLFAFFWGLVFAPELENDGIQEAVAILKKLTNT